jgi:hypothetical protein
MFLCLSFWSTFSSRIAVMAIWCVARYWMGVCGGGQHARIAGFNVVGVPSVIDVMPLPL